MFEFQYFLTGVMTMIGFVNAMPPRLLLSRLKNLRCREGNPAQIGRRDIGNAGSGA